MKKAYQEQKDAMGMLGNRAATLADVAERAGVSRMTVSAVLSGKTKHVRVSENTRAKVLRAAQELAYHPNAVARSLRSKRTRVIGFYGGLGYLNASLPFYSEIIGGLQFGCDQHHLDLLVHGTFPQRTAKDVYAELVDGRLDGLVIHTLADDPLVPLLIQSHLPVVAVADAIEGLPSVVVDDIQGGKLQAQHVAKAGHTKVLYRDNFRALTSVVRRREAFREEARKIGLDVVVWEGVEQTIHDTSVRASFVELLKNSRATAVVCWNDMSAYDTLDICYQYGWRVPEEVAIVGYDGIQVMGNKLHGLTTVRAPWLKVATKAVELLVDQLHEHFCEPLEKEVVFPVEIVYGQTA